MNGTWDKNNEQNLVRIKQKKIYGHNIHGRKTSIGLGFSFRVYLIWPQPNPPKIQLTNIFPKVLAAHVLANVGKKNKLEFAMEHGHAKILATIQARAKISGMTKKLMWLSVVHRSKHTLTTKYSTLLLISYQNMAPLLKYLHQDFLAELVSRYTGMMLFH